MPSLREKKRYVAFEVIADKKVKFQNVAEAIWKAILTFIGVKGTAEAGIIPIPEKWDSSKQRGTVRVNHKHVDNLKAAFIFITDIRGQPAIVRSLRVSGMLHL